MLLGSSLALCTFSLLHSWADTVKLSGDDLAIDGRAFRSGTLSDQKGPAQLGVKGGHPYECVRLERLNCPHSYVFLVRMLRIGSEASQPSIAATAP